jgi:hypothetical protein
VLRSTKRSTKNTSNPFLGPLFLRRLGFDSLKRRS